MPRQRRVSTTCCALEAVATTNWMGRCCTVASFRTLTSLWTSCLSWIVLLLIGHSAGDGAAVFIAVISLAIVVDERS